MRAVTVRTVISAPREQVFEQISDLSGRVAWADHLMRDYRLARANPRGPGAAARFCVRAPLARRWVELNLTEVEPPRRVVETGRFGRGGASRFVAIWELVAESPTHTRVELTAWTEPSRADARVERLGGRRWLRGQLRTALQRLRLVFEDPPQAPLARVTVAGYEPAKHARFGA